MTGPSCVADTRYSHDLLLHDCDDDLVAATQAFVELGLASGGQVLVHGPEERVDLLRAALGSHPRLEYGLDRDLYLTPMSTLFAYARRLAADPSEFWVTGTVPLGGDPAGHAAWTRYESLVNEVLGRCAFHAMCTYDTRTLPARTIAAAKAAHPGLSISGDRSSHSADYLEPATFLTNPLAGVPDPTDAPPAVALTLHALEDLSRVRDLVTHAAESSGAVSRDTVGGFVAASNEVLVNALTHGAAPVDLMMWVELASLTCRITDAGPGIPDTLTGYRYPRPRGPKGVGLWVARQLCETLILSNRPGGGCSVLLATA